MEMGEQEPLVFHHHYLPCPVTSLSPMSLWPSSFLSVPPHQPPWQGAPRIQHQPPASRQGEVQVRREGAWPRSRSRSEELGVKPQKPF